MTLRGITLALSVAAIGLGIVHLALALLAFGEWSLDALWFVGAGLAIVAGAAINLVAPTGRGRFVALTVDAALTLWFAAAWSVLPGPQVVIGGLLFAGLAVCAVLDREKPDLA